MPEPKIIYVSAEELQKVTNANNRKNFRNAIYFPTTEINEAIKYAQSQGGGGIGVPVANDLFGLGNGIEIKNNKDPLVLYGIPNEGIPPTIGGNIDEDGFILTESGNVTIKGLNFQGNRNGILLKSFSNYNTLILNTANLNNHVGICLDSSSNNTLTDNTANNNSWEGILLKSFSNYNTLILNTANLNNHVGICLDSSSNNTLIRNTANSNIKGIYLDRFSDYNTLIRNCAIWNEKRNFYIPSYDSKGGDNIQNVFGRSDVPPTVEIRRVVKIGDLLVPINPLNWGDYLLNWWNNPLKRRVI